MNKALIKSLDSEFLGVATLSIILAVTGSLLLIAMAVGVAGVAAVIAGQTGWLAMIGYACITAMVIAGWVIYRRKQR